MVFHWSLIDSKSPLVSRALLSLLVVLNSAVVWMVSTRPPTSNTSSPLSNPLVTVPNAPITIGTIYQPLRSAGYDTRSIFFFKQSLTGLNSEFSFS